MNPTVKHIKYKTLSITFFMVLFWFAIISRLFLIQVKNNEKYSSYATNMAYKKIDIQPHRGLLLDRKGKKLTINATTYSLAVHPHLIEDKNATAKSFATFLNKPAHQFLQKFNQTAKFIWIDRDIPAAAADTLKKLYAGDQSVVIKEKIHRKYPYNDLAGQTLGFTNVDNVGIEGLERALDRQLSGIHGFRTYFMTGKGDYETRPNLPYEPPVNGKNATLTIDIEYQNILHEEICAVQEKYKADKAMGILIDPNTGEILAMASAPALNPNNYAAYPVEYRKNPLVTDVFEPGSTFKIVTAAAALEEDFVTPEDVIETHQGYVVIQRRTIHDHEKLPDMTFADVIRHSSNVGTIRVAQKMGTETLFHYVRKFGFGTKSNALLPGEVNGIMKKINGWTPLRSAQISMGQGIGCTALQLVYAYAAIANGGYLLQPQILKSITDEKGNTEFLFNKKIIRQVASENTMHTIRNLLLNTVETGTGSKAKVCGMDIAGKTGTSQKVKPEGGYSKTDYIASFVGFFPAQNPKLLCAVIVDNPRGGVYYGGTVSAPVVKNVFKRVVNMSEDLFFEDFEEKTPVYIAEQKSIKDSNEKRVIYTRGAVQNESIRVPDLRGLSMVAAIQKCQGIGLKIDVQGSGRAISQSLRRGSYVKAGTICKVTFSDKG